MGYLSPTERILLHLVAEAVAVSRAEAMMAPVLNWQQLVIRYMRELRQGEAYVVVLASLSQDRIELVIEHIRHLAREGERETERRD